MSWILIWLDIRYWIFGWFLMPDTWHPAVYLADDWYPANYLITGIRIKPDFQYTNSFNIQFPDIWPTLDIQPNPNFIRLKIKGALFWMVCNRSHQIQNRSTTENGVIFVFQPHFQKINGMLSWMAKMWKISGKGKFSSKNNCELCVCLIVLI